MSVRRGQGRTSGVPRAAVRGSFSLPLLVAATLFLSALSSPAATLATRSCAVVLSNAVVVGLSNRLSGERLVAATAQWPAWSGLARLDQSALQGGRAKWQPEITATQAIQEIAKWELPDHGTVGGMTTRVEVDSATDDLVVTQEGQLASSGLVGVSWGIASVPDDVDVLVPGCSGQRFSADSPAQRRTFDYPMMWEAPFVLIQGRRGGAIIWADDATHRFKTLVLDHSQRAFRLRFESRCTAPFEDKREITSSRWRIRAYAGNWQTGAAIYRQWAKARFGLLPLAQKSPAWAAETQFVVIMGQDPALLKTLATHCNPKQTLLYLAGWRQDGYDRNYPDYRPNATLAPFMAEAHRLGFRVMLHVNYFGCDPQNATYETLKQWQIRDPFSGELQWWEWPAQPPIKFAYINPASRAWRELFVQRMVDVVAQTGADALHLDQTLCIYNDRNGVIDGLNCIEGSLALHRELREALPQVALSGEGLNEITSQYEHFAQRHIWSMDHVHRTWDDRQVMMAHAISSSVLTPYTHIYGYLGMANPADTALFNVWRRAYEHWGVLPTYAWPNVAQLEPLAAPVADLLDQARFFQDHQPAPDLTSPWHGNDLFVYQLNDGGSARYSQDQGVAFEAQLRGEPARVLARRIEGVAEARLPGSIPGWLAYDSKRILGLNPQRAYGWSPAMRDPAAPHLSALPAGFVLSQAGRQSSFARFRIMRSPVEEAKHAIRLWDYTGPVTGGVRLASGVVRTYAGLEFEDEDSAGNAHPDGDGLFVHPPWKNTLRTATNGGNATFLDFPLRLPDVAGIRFSSGVELRRGAEGKSDGACFRVIATCGKEQRRNEVLHASEKSGSLELDLSAWRGKPILLRLETDPGPAGAPDFDWARFIRPQIATRDNFRPTSQTIRFAGVPYAAKPLAADGAVKISLPAPKADQSTELSATCRLPNTLILPLSKPVEAMLPFSLLDTNCSSTIVFDDGIELPAYSYYRASAMTAQCAGTTRQALSLHPPAAGKALADWWLRLPAAPARLVTAIGLRDGSSNAGVQFTVEVNGRKVLERVATPKSAWTPVDLSLAEWRGQPVLITFVTEPTTDANTAWAVWAEPRLLPAQ